MAAVLVLEGMLLPTWLKPHWRPWARPCPDPAGTGLLASVWLRLEALRSAVRSRVPLRLGQRAGIAGVNVLPASGRYAMRDRAKAATYREEPEAGDASDSDGASHASQAPQLDRAARALKRSKVRADHADGSEDESAYGGATQEEAWEGKRSRLDHSEPPTAQASPSVSSSSSASEDNAQDQSFAPSSSDEEFGGSPMDRDEA
ncbi:hypothetical protein H632_c1461p0 [Helicosporidium sp. ATCC 50920]|nr:hypothetical protein H632_c1461p0 [Helicosporidium sp. ATCC 50920]|eukprot:KDD74242.1 hypothetical protein H632_c1461p0 [Helicosporidium sp. ATCC 50920]